MSLPSLSLSAPVNILDIQDELKGWPDDRLVGEMQAPTGTAPQFLVFTELSRRQDMRKRFQEEQARQQGEGPNTTMAQEAIMEAQGVPAGAPPGGPSPDNVTPGGLGGQPAPMPQPPIPGTAPMPMPQGVPPQMPGYQGGGIVRGFNSGGLAARRIDAIDDEIASLGLQMSRLAASPTGRANILRKINNLKAEKAALIASGGGRGGLGSIETPEEEAERLRREAEERKLNMSTEDIIAESLGQVQGFQPPTTRTDMPDASPEMMAAQKYVSSEYETPESIRRLRERMEVRARDIEKGSGISPWDWFKAAGAARKEKDAFGALGAGLEQLGIAGADRESAGRREMMDLLKEDVYLSGIEERGRGTHEQVEQKKQSGAVDAAVRKYGLELKEWGLDEAFSRDILKSQLSLAERLIDNSMKDKAAARKFNNERRLVVLEMIKDQSIVMSQEVIGIPKLDWVVKMNSLGGRTTVPGSAVWDEELARRLTPFYAAANVPQPGFTSPIPRSTTTPSP